MQRKLSAVISDFDDTLFFNDKCIRAASLEVLGKELTARELKTVDRTDKSRIYSIAYSKHSDKLTPNYPVLGYLRKMHGRGYDIIIMSARGEEHREITKEMLSNEGILYEDVILPRDHSIPDQEWKLKELKKLSKKYDELIFLEDKLENISYIMKRYNYYNTAFYLVKDSLLIYQNKK
jgi:hypothetical protein